MPTIKQQFIPKSRTKQRPGYAMTPLYITIHSTGNPASTAQNEADYVCYNSTRQASYHYVCDDTDIIQVLPVNEIGWHAGDGGSGTGNRKSVAIEICESGNRKKAVDNAVWLTKELMRDLNIDKSHIKQHHDWSKKDCPRILRNPAYVKDGIDWDYFLVQLDAKTEEKEEEMTQEELEVMLEKYFEKVAKQDPGDWSADARKWAEENGIITGDEGGKRYKSHITREEAVVMLHRAIK